METGVVVVGVGQVGRGPDVLRVSFGVEHVAADVAVVVAQVAERTDAVVAALRGQGIEASAIGTTTVNVNQEYREPGEAAAYRASHMLTVTTKDLTAFGELLNAAVGAAGNNLSLHGMEFDIEDKTELVARARELAFEQAREKAAHLAALAGYSLGSVSSVSETQAHFPRLASAKLGGGGGAAYDSVLTITPDANQVQVSLEVHFSWA